MISTTLVILNKFSFEIKEKMEELIELGFSEY